jgi:hypothetical protein
MVLAVSAAACTDGGSDNGGSGSGNDVLPKRGESTTDPTIVSASARCGGGEFSFKGLVIVIAATDAGGTENLGSCAVNLGGTTQQGTFEGSCYVEASPTCTANTDYTVGITVSNNTGGITTASVKLRAAGMTLPLDGPSN